MNRVHKSHIPVAAQTHPGMTGKNNEDRYAVSAFQIGPPRSPTPVLLAVLSDGIGGHRGGEVAAEMTVDLISQSIAAGDARYPQPMLEHAVQDASQKIYAQAQKDIRLQGMGATVVIAWIIGERLYVANVGDSRVYLMRGGGISQLSSDHTWVQEALAGGLITPEEVFNHPNAHIIRRFLGSPTPPEVDLRLRLHPDEDDAQALKNQGMALESQDILLLCSDGLTDLVNDAEILAAFEAAPLQEAVQSLVDLACQRGGHDNITLVALQMPEQNPPPVDRRTLGRLKGCAALGLAVLVTGLLAILAFWGIASYLDRHPRLTPTPQATLKPTQLPPIQFITSTPRPGASLTPRPTPTVLPSVTPTRSNGPLSPALPSLTPWPTNTP